MRSKLLHFRVPMPYRGINIDRIVHVRLPSGYDQNPEQKYPVLYMQDGQNLFYDRHAYQGVSWGLRPTLSRWERNDQNTRMIVVGVECDPIHRMREYSPWPMKVGKLVRPSEVWGDAYAAWFVQTLVPLIESKFRTIRRSQGRAIGGSSAGANISLYIARKYPHIFGAVGLFSAALWVFDQEEEKVASIRPERKDAAGADMFFYVYSGTEEGGDDQIVSQAYLSNAATLVLTLLRNGVDPKNVHLEIRHGRPHHETAWREIFPEFLVAWQAFGRG